MEVVKQSENPKLPDIKYHWDENKTDIILNNIENNKDVQIKKIE